MRQKIISILLVAFAAIATGTMLVLALPLGEQAYLAWFMLAPLLIATREKGFLAGFLGGLVAVSWCAFLAGTGVFYQTKNFEMDCNWTYSGCGLFAIVFSLFFAIWADQKNHEKPAWWFAAIAVCLESILLLILPAPLAITQYRSPLMMIVASLVGIWGVSFLIWIINVACVKKPYVWWPVALFIAFLSTGRRPDEPTEPTEGMVVAVSQFADGLDKELAASHVAISAQKPVFDVWPEFAGMLFVRGDDTSKLTNLSSMSSPIVTSFRDTFQPLPHNVAALFEDGKESPHYAKRKLFGSETKMHTSGTKAVAVHLGSARNFVGLNICYDSCFPYVIRETASLPDVNVIALPTIDPDSRHYFIAGMHAAFTPFRAAENGVAMARADGHFGSMIVDNHGRIVAELHDEQKSISAKVSSQRMWTLYQLIGDLFWYGCIVAVFIPPIQKLVKKKKAAPEKQN